MSTKVLPVSGNESVVPSGSTDFALVLALAGEAARTRLARAAMVARPPSRASRRGRVDPKGRNSALSWSRRERFKDAMSRSYERTEPGSGLRPMVHARHREGVPGGCRRAPSSSGERAAPHPVLQCLVGAEPGA